MVRSQAFLDSEVARGCREHLDHATRIFRAGGARDHVGMTIRLSEELIAKT
jgi:hypothetical protein